MNDPTEYLYIGDEDQNDDQPSPKPMLSKEQRDKIIHDLQSKRDARRRQLEEEINQKYNEESIQASQPLSTQGKQSAKKNNYMKDPSEILVNTEGMLNRNAPIAENPPHKINASMLSGMYSPISQQCKSVIDAEKAEVTQMHLEEPKKKVTVKEANKAKYLSNTISNELNSCKQESKKVKELKNKREGDFKKECPFKPLISTTTEDYISESKHERIERLMLPKTTQLQKRERLKKQKDEEEFKDHCTFKPEISIPKRESKSTAPLADRLHHEADTRAEKREKELREREEMRMKECTFKPEVHVKNDYSQKPIYDRFKEIQKAHNEKIQKLRVESEKENQKLFKPKVNQKSNIIVEEKRIIEGECNNVTNRLVKDAAIRIEKSLRKAEEATQMQSVQYTFKPKVTTTTHSLVIGENYEKDFHARQQEFIQKQRDKAQMQAVVVDNHCTFKPQINVTSEIMMEADPKRNMESLQAKLERLSYKDAKKAEMNKEIIEKEELEKYSFKPTINTVSKTLGRQITVQEMADDKQRKQNLQAIAEEVKENEMRECKFKPTLYTNSSKFDVDSHYKTGKEILKEIEDVQKQKQDKAEQLKRDIEYYQMLECSFKPKTNNEVLEAQKPVIIRGLDRHLELQELKKRIEKEKQEREDKVFGIGKGENRVGYTIPEPFKLCTEKRAAIKK